MRKAEKNYYDSNGDSRLMSSAYDQSSPYSQTAYVGPTTRARQTAQSALSNPMYLTMQNIGDTEVTRPDGSRVLSLTRTAGKNKENLDQRYRDLLMEAYTKPKRSYETQARMNIIAKPKTSAEYQRLSDAITFMGNMMGDNNRGYLQAKASPPIKPGPVANSSTMKRMSNVKKGINWGKLTSRALHGGADVVRDTASKINHAIGYSSFKPGTMNEFALRGGRRTSSRVASAPNRFSIKQNGWDALDAVPMRVTRKPWDGGPIFPAAYLTDAQAKKISRLAGRAYDFGEEQLARRSDELLDPRMASAFNNRTNRAINNTSKILAPLAALALGSGYVADKSKSKLRSAASSRGVMKRASKPKNKYGV